MLARAGGEEGAKGCLSLFMNSTISHSCVPSGFCPKVLYCEASTMCEILVNQGTILLLAERGSRVLVLVHIDAAVCTTPVLCCLLCAPCDLWRQPVNSLVWPRWGLSVVWEM